MATKIINSRTKNPLLRTAIYIRVSTDRQAVSGDSLDEQMDTLQNHINTHDNLIHAGTYIDDGISGQKLNRGDFHRLICDVEADKIDLIIFTKLDRWFRSLKHYLNTQDILDAHRCNWLAVSQPYFDTSTPHGRAFIAQSMTFAELEAQNDSTRIRDVFNYKYKQGQVLSGSTPLGYSIVDKHLVPNEDADKARAIFEYYSRTSNLNQTILFMEREFGIVMCQANLKKCVLSNKKYIGVFRDNENFCEAIIDRNLFEDVQRKLQRNVKRSQKHTYVFSGLIVCSHCDHTCSGCMQYSLYKGKKYNYPGYRCRLAYPNKRCNNRRVYSESKLERYLLENIHQLISEFLFNYELSQAPAVDNRQKRASIQKKIDRLKDLYVNEMITMDEYKEDRAKYMQQLESLSEDTAEAKDLSALRNFLELDLDSIYGTLDAEQKRYLWRSIIKEIRVDYNHNYQIIFL